MEDLEYFEYIDYTDNGTNENISGIGSVIFYPPKLFSVEIMVIINILIALLGLGGNAIVIWISWVKMKTSVNTISYLSLAISDFLFCVCLPFNIVHMATSDWPFGLVMCKLTSSVMFLNMFSSVFLLVLISVERCILVTLPVWAQNHLTVPRASGAVVFAWALSAALTVPSLIHRQIKKHGDTTLCYTDYQSGHKAVALTRFVCGFGVPFLIITFCYLVIFVKLRSRPMKSMKPVKVMTALIMAFFVCWLPYHTFALLELNLGMDNLNMVNTGMTVGVTLASANSFLNPILYAFMGNDVQQTLKRSILWRIENTMAEDGRTGRRNLSKSGSVESKAFTYI
ncbi:chemokine-like receptor 1 [Esox lucius]|uniref:G-protein coupled receptors family 1 profile domain-containing protein n=1 Tax=Esox lucius TaxID=8010 RepID=A0A3P8Z0S6_ESOLU|nr:chemokine-like receptor 1 [Esox lucius]